jgi:hypothetical protein
MAIKRTRRKSQALVDYVMMEVDWHVVSTVSSRRLRNP